MSEYNEDDLVEATLGDTVIRGRIGGCSGDWLGNSRRQIPGLITDGFTITVIEKAAPKLPTEPGWYVDRFGCMWQKHDDGEMSRLVNAAWSPEHCAPFTRLEPVPETAKKVIAALNDAIQASDVERESGFSVRSRLRELSQDLARQFGATS